MTALAHIGHGVEKKLITAIVSGSEGKGLLETVANLPGVLSTSFHHARGTGSRRVRPGRLFWAEKDVLMVLVEAPEADAVFARLFEAGGIGEPRQGLLFMEGVRRGHPMMPFAG